MLADDRRVRAFDGFAAFVQAYAQKSAQSRRRHFIAMNDVKFLPKAMQTPLLQLERKVTEQVADLLRGVKPDLRADIYKPYAMMLLGMPNWTDYWYRPGGPMKPAELCERITRLFLLGFMAEK